MNYLLAFLLYFVGLILVLYSNIDDSLLFSLGMMIAFSAGRLIPFN